MPWEDHECLSRVENQFIGLNSESMIGNTSDEEKGIPFWGKCLSGSL